MLLYSVKLRKEAVVAVKKAQLQSTVNDIHSKYDEAVKDIKEGIDCLREAINSREQLLIKGLTSHREKLDCKCQVARGHLEAYGEKANELKSKAEGLRGDPSADVKGLLEELTALASRNFKIDIPDTDFKFTLNESISIMEKNVEELLVLPISMEKEEAFTIQGRVGSNLTKEGDFTVVKPWEESLRVISNSIRADIGLNIIHPVFQVEMGKIYAAKYEGEWHRAKVVTFITKTRVKINYVDYGNNEECMVTDLMSLPGKYLIYPFRAIRCCLFNDDREFSREACWKFSDHLLGKQVTVEVDSKLAGTDGEEKYVVHIIQPGSWAAISQKILADAGDKKHDDPIKYRDVRLKSDTVSAPGRIVVPSGARDHQVMPRDPVMPSVLRGETVNDADPARGRPKSKDDEFQMLFVKGYPLNYPWEMCEIFLVDMGT